MPEWRMHVLSAVLGTLRTDCNESIRSNSMPIRIHQVGGPSASDLTVLNPDRIRIRGNTIKEVLLVLEISLRDVQRSLDVASFSAFTQKLQSKFFQARANVVVVHTP